MSDDREQARKWMDEAEEALSRAGEALRTAWEDREARMSTLEAAREAATRLGAAIDQGIEAAKQSWAPATEADPGRDPQESAQEEE